MNYGENTPTLGNDALATLAGLLLTLVAIAAQAGPAPCSPTEAGRLAFSVESGEAVAFDGLPAANVAIDRQHFAFAPNTGDGVAIGYGHQYSIVDFQRLPVDASSNGHLHTLSIPIDLSAPFEGLWTFRFQPAVSISSNLLKSPDDIHHDALQPNFAVTRRFGETAKSHWLAGLCGDHRFGAWRAYPTVAWIRESGPWSLRLGWPDSIVKVRIDDSWSTGLRVHPDGNRWLIHDDDIGDSVYEHKGWRVEAFLDWQFARRWQAGLIAGKLFDSRHELILENGAAVAGDTASPWQIRLAFARRL